MPISPDEGNVWVLSGPFYYRTMTKYHSDADQARWGAGITTQADVDENGGLEIGMFYLDKLYFRKKRPD